MALMITNFPYTNFSTSHYVSVPLTGTGFSSATSITLSNPDYDWSVNFDPSTMVQSDTSLYFTTLTMEKPIQPGAIRRPHPLLGVLQSLGKFVVSIVQAALRLLGINPGPGASGSGWLTITISGSGSSPFQYQTKNWTVS